MMAMFFAQRVILGKMGFEAVPAKLKSEVAKALCEAGLADIVPSEYRTLEY